MGIGANRRSAGGAVPDMSDVNGREQCRIFFQKPRVGTGPPPNGFLDQRERSIRVSSSGPSRRHSPRRAGQTPGLRNPHRSAERTISPSIHTWPVPRRGKTILSVILLDWRVEFTGPVLPHIGYYCLPITGFAVKASLPGRAGLQIFHMGKGGKERFFAGLPRDREPAVRVESPGPLPEAGACRPECGYIALLDHTGRPGTYFRPRSSGAENRRADSGAFVRAGAAPRWPGTASRPPGPGPRSKSPAYRRCGTRWCRFEAEGECPSGCPWSPGWFRNPSSPRRNGKNLSSAGKSRGSRYAAPDWKSAARQEAMPVSIPCQNGEFADRASKCGRYCTRALRTAMAESPSGMPT